MKTETPSGDQTAAVPPSGTGDLAGEASAKVGCSSDSSSSRFRFLLASGVLSGRSPRLGPGNGGRFAGMPVTMLTRLSSVGCALGCGCQSFKIRPWRRVLQLGVAASGPARVRYVAGLCRQLDPSSAAKC